MVKLSAINQPIRKRMRKRWKDRVKASRASVIPQKTSPHHGHHRHHHYHHQHWVVERSHQVAWCRLMNATHSSTVHLVHLLVLLTHKHKTKSTHSLYMHWKGLFGWEEARSTLGPMRDGNCSQFIYRREMTSSMFRIVVVVVVVWLYFSWRCFQYIGLLAKALCVRWWCRR